MTAQTLINSAMRLIGATASGETPTTDESNDALVVLNDMLDQWNSEHLMTFTTQPHTFALTTSQTYTLGTGGAFNMARPARIEQAVLQINTDPTFPLEFVLRQFTDEEWEAITIKSLSNTYPMGFWDDGGFPLRTLYFWPIPSGVSLNVVIYPWEPLTSFASLSTDNSYPPGYNKALRYNLAVDLAAEFEQPLNPQVAITAARTKGKLKTMNSEPPLMTPDRALMDPKKIPGVSRADFLGGRF